MTEIIEYPNPVLSKVALPVDQDEFGSEGLKKLVVQMERTIFDTDANGLAAVQIGVDKALIIYRNKKNDLIPLCNPKIIARTGKVKSYGEGCLSSPGFRADIRRSKEIKVVAQTIDGEVVTFREKGFPAIILQHEIDHINGKTLISLTSDLNINKRAYMKEHHGIS